MTFNIKTVTNYNCLTGKIITQAKRVKGVKNILKIGQMNYFMLRPKIKSGSRNYFCQYLKAKIESFCASYNLILNMLKNYLIIYEIIEFELMFDQF
jgi:hypothetical protein